MDDYDVPTYYSVKYYIARYEVNKNSIVQILCATIKNLREKL